MADCSTVGVLLDGNSDGMAVGFADCLVGDLDGSAVGFLDFGVIEGEVVGKDVR